MIICFDSLFQLAQHWLQLYHQAGYQNPFWIIKDALTSIYNFWTANPNHGDVCSSQ